MQLRLIVQRVGLWCLLRGMRYLLLLEVADTVLCLAQLSRESPGLGLQLVDGRYQLLPEAVILGANGTCLGFIHTDPM